MKKDYSKKEIKAVFKTIDKFKKNHEQIQDDYIRYHEKKQQEEIWIITDSSSSFNNIKEFING